MTNDWLKRDPQAQAEAEKYGKPAPSRDFLLEFLQEWGSPISHPRLCRELGIDDDDCVEAVSRRLKAMCRDGQLMSNRRSEFGIIKKMDLIAGRVIGHRDGFGFVTPDAGGDDLFISPRQMRQVFDGDRVLVQEISIDYRGRREGKIIEVLERGTLTLVGRYKVQGDLGYLIPENQRITQQIMIAPDTTGSPPFRDGQLVVAQLMEQPGKHQIPQARVIEVLGDHMAPGMEIKVAIHNYEIPSEWPEAVRHEVGNLSAQVEESAKQNRIDLRHLPLVTIDGEDAKDFDDAVYAERKRTGGWRLWVAIADVSWYVRPGTELDKEGLTRGNSVYFPEYVVPMLPEVLSNGLCSLNPHVDRLAMVCEMTISAGGKLSGYQFYEAVIQSQARLTYNKVGTILTEPKSTEGQRLRGEYAKVVPHLEALYSLYFGLRKARDARGAIDFETVETRIMFSDQRKIEEIVPVERNDAHKLIEECMLCANVATARFLTKLKVPALYRIHEGPKDQKLVSLRAYLGELGLALGGGDKPEPSEYQKLATLIEGRPDRNVIQTMMLRSMRQAVYSPENKGHFGLAYAAYTHFTSPIRRYPDLLVHRAIRAAIHAESDRSLLDRLKSAFGSGSSNKAMRRPDNFKSNPAFRYRYSDEQMLQLGEHCSMTERRADDATRDVMSWLKCEYMLDQVGEEHEGVISAVTGFGVFVELKKIYVEGLVHITALPSDYYHFDAAKQRLVGERMRKTFKLGDLVRVKVMRVDLDERKIDFELQDKPGSGKTKSTRERLAEGALGDGKSSDKSGKPSGRGRSRSAGSARAEGAKPEGSKSAAGKPASSKPASKSRRPRSRGKRPATS